MNKISNINKEEVDLIEILLGIWKKKWNIISLTFVLLILTTIFNFFFQDKDPKIYVTNEIKSIPAFDNEKYKIASNVLNALSPFFESSEMPGFDAPNENLNAQKQYNKTEKDYLITMKNLNYYGNLQITNINKELLMNLFIDQLDQEENIKTSLIESRFFKKEDYPSEIEFQSALNDFSFKVKLSIQAAKEELGIEKKYLTIELNKSQIENWKNFLKYFEKKTNEEIRMNLIELIENYSKNILFIKKIKITEIEKQMQDMQGTDDEYIKSKLNYEKNFWKNKNFELILKKVFEDSPISKSDKFYAATINYDQITYDLKNKYSMMKLYIIITIIGLMLGSVFALFSIAIENRK